MVEIGLNTLLAKLGYDRSPNYLAVGRGLEAALDFGHIYRRAVGGLCRLQGVYRLCPSQEQASSIPIVYVCQADTEAQAREVHRLVWNQGLVPYLIVVSPRNIRLYSGFTYRREERDARDDASESATGLLDVFDDLASLSRLLKDFHADAIDSGQLWRSRAQRLDISHRVDWNLLENLNRLGQWLMKDGGLEKATAHALIGKYVYLHYLKDREILSARKLESWGIRKEDVFGRSATLAGLIGVTRQLDQWLNGQIFPLPLTGANAPTEAQLRRVAGAFAGDRELASGARQLHLAFDAYDFSYIPIETLSVIYEQFLHAADDSDDNEVSGADAVTSDDDGLAPDIDAADEASVDTIEGIGTSSPPRRARARKLGAFYTPIPLVNFVLDELDSQRPLARGIRVLDPACGSGAFLVQCYRRLVERSFPVAGAIPPQPVELRELLTEHIFGVDLDENACRVTEMSLQLTLLDYIDPPDLESVDFKLPSLHNTNIVHGDFFDPKLALNRADTPLRFDRIVANPPWKTIEPKSLDREDRHVWAWIRQNQKELPVGDNQAARAFVWKALSHLVPNGETGIVIPAMTLFDNPSEPFRREFFKRVQVRAIANFSNLAEVLFAGRSRVPAAMLVYSQRLTAPTSDERIPVFSPLVANQELTRPSGPGNRTESWGLALNASEVREVSTRSVVTGSALPWKLASWGSFLDQRLLERVSGRFPTLESLEKAGVLVVSEGLQLRTSGQRGQSEPLEEVRELIGQKQLQMSALKRLRTLFDFPVDAISRVEEGKHFVRKRGGVSLPLSVCRPPHIILSEARTFAVYSDEFLVVPARQIGITNSNDDRDFLKALSLYLSSDFMFYHQFMESSHFGVKRPVATLSALRQFPVPITGLSRSELREWASLHGRLVQASRRSQVLHSKQVELSFGHSMVSRTQEGTSFDQLLDELNERVFDSLQIRKNERCLVRDLVRVRLKLDDGKIGTEAVRDPEGTEILAYGRMLKQELDGFVFNAVGMRHQIHILPCSSFGVVEIRCEEHPSQDDVLVLTSAGDSKTWNDLHKLSRQILSEGSQWLFFNRNLRVYRGTRTYLFKPMQRFHWTESQARLDAADVIAETLMGTGGDA